MFCDKTQKNDKGKTRMPVRLFLHYPKKEITVAEISLWHLGDDEVLGSRYFPKININRIF